MRNENQGHTQKKKGGPNSCVFSWPHEAKKKVGRNGGKLNVTKKKEKKKETEIGMCFGAGEGKTWQVLWLKFGKESQENKTKTPFSSWKGKCGCFDDGMLRQKKRGRKTLKALRGLMYCPHIDSIKHKKNGEEKGRERGIGKIFWRGKGWKKLWSTFGKATS